MNSQIFISSPTFNLPTRAITQSSLTLQSLLPPHLSSSSLFFTLSSLPLPLSTPLSSLPPSSHILLHLRLLAGGGDGGSTCAESRDCYLNMYAVKKPDQPDPNETRISRWTTCALSSDPLTPPCVTDLLGNLFNKQSLVEALIHKKLPKAFSYIRGLKDMIPITLTPIPGVKSGTETMFQCPISGLEFNGKCGFVAIRTCGHVVSTKALKEVKATGCLVCREEFGEADKIVINGSEEEVAVMRERMEEGRGKKVKTKKVKREGEVVENGKKEGGGKRFKATDIAPEHATEVYASIFTSSKKKDFKETYMCRSLPLARN